MIISSHFSVHGGFEFPIASISLNKLWRQFMIMGAYGNNLFILISGYFLVESKVCDFRKIFNLWLRIFFYSVLFFWLFIFLGLEKFSLKIAIKSLIPILANRWWYATAYFALYFVHPYLNILLKSLSKEEYRKFLILIFTCQSLLPTLTFLSAFNIGISNFICLYSLAAYFRLWDQDFGNKKFIFYGAVFLFANFISALIIDIIALKFPSIETDKNVFYLYGMMRPFTILGTLFLFLGFRSLHIKNKFINIIAPATFGIYLIHEHDSVKPFLWQKVFQNASFQNSPYLIPYSIGVVILVFFVCALIELARAKIFKFISHGKLS